MEYQGNLIRMMVHVPKLLRALLVGVGLLIAAVETTGEPRVYDSVQTVEKLHPYIHADGGSCELVWNLCQKEA